MAVVVPVLALAALVEGTISPSGRFPAWAKAALGVALAAGLWGFLARAGVRARGDGQGARAGGP